MVCEFPDSIKKGKIAVKPYFCKQLPVAIVGMGCIFPGANSLEQFWENIISGVNCIREVPRSRWDAAIHYDPSGRDRDKSYSKLGAFVDDFKVDPVKFRIPPIAATFIDRSQFLVLEAATQALEDACYSDVNIPRERTGVFLGSEGGGSQAILYALRVNWARFTEALRSVRQFEELPESLRYAIMREAEAAWKRTLPEFSEDTVSGTSGSLLVGRICNCLNLKGIGLIVNAACASSLAAVEAGIQALREGRLDVVLAGGVDSCMEVETYVNFCSAGVLSDTGCFPFDERADGMVLGEGAGVVVLKRVGDAMRDGDRIYALIRGVGYSSDGRGRGITAPDVYGQIRAMRSAYEGLPFSPGTVSLMEAHGTGTWIGDRIEFTSLTEFLSPHVERKQTIAIGSVKSMIGHLKAAAGVAGLIKTALALHRKMMPPTINCKTPRKDVDWKNSPLFPITDARKWPSERNPRRAGINSFGFGGVNYHAVLEEAPSAGDVEWQKGLFTASATCSPAALLVFRANSRQELLEQVRYALGKIVGADNRSLRRMSHDLSHIAQERQGPTLAVVSSDSAELSKLVSDGLKIITDDNRHEYSSEKGVYFGETALSAGEKIAFVFPGQGSQYLDMAGDLPDCFPFVGDIFRLVDAYSRPALGLSVFEVLCCEGGVTERKGALLNARLHEPDFIHPVMLGFTMGLFEVLVRAGVNPDMVAGHSLGEYFALRASGVFDTKTAIDIAIGRGKGISGCRLGGAMAAIAAAPDVIAPLLEEDPGFVAIANRNCNSQTVISGDIEAVERVTARLKDRGFLCQRLPVAHGFHSRLLKSCAEPFFDFLRRFSFRLPNIPVQCNLTGRAYEVDSNFDNRIRETLVKHLTEPVNFMSNILSMYDAGARVFIEVGPGSTLSSFIDNTLVGKPHWTIPTNRARRSPSLQVLRALAFCASRGLRVDIRGIIPDADQATDAFYEIGPLSKRETLYCKNKRRTRIGKIEALKDKPMNQEIWRKVQKAVSRKTGYPLELIDPDLDVEADLGIDSIKLAGIINELERIFGIMLPTEGQKGRYRLITLRTLVEDLSDPEQVKNYVELEQVLERAESVPAANLEFKTSCYHWVCESVEAPFRGDEEGGTINGRKVLLLVRSDAQGLELKRLIERNGGTVDYFLPHDRFEKCPSGFDTVLDTWGYRGEGLPGLGEFESWWDRRCSEIASMLHIVQKFIQSVRSGRVSAPLWVEVTSLGGLLGAGAAGRVTTTAGIGLATLRALKGEIPEVEVLTIDFEGGESAKYVAQCVVDELCRKRRFFEIGYSKGCRHEIHWRIDNDLFEERVLSLDSESVILAIGGARGIAAAICRRLAELRGGKFIIVGRSPVGDWRNNVPFNVTFSRVREQLMRDIMVGGEKISPSILDNMAWRKVWETERVVNLRLIFEAGGEVSYRQCDVTNAEATMALIGELRTEFERIDLVIQSGGDVVSKSLENFQHDEFAECVRSKGLGTACLLAAMENMEVSTFVNISSVAGRWSDPGQAAYGAGHEVASILVTGQRSRREGRWINIFYGPWREVGMARLGDASRRMCERGVNFATEVTGVEAFINVLSRSTNENVGFCGREFALKWRQDIIPIAGNLVEKMEIDEEIKRIFGITGALAIAKVDLRQLRAFLEGGDKSFLEEYFSKDEMPVLQNFVSEKRGLEWIGGRIAAKVASASVIGPEGPPLNAIHVIRSEKKIPKIRFSEPFSGMLFPHISISHSHKEAVALAAAGFAVGIDIELITDAILEIKDEFCTTDECEMLRHRLEASEAEILTRIWTMKEAAIKVPATEGLLLRDLTLVDSRHESQYIVAKLKGRCSETVKAISYLLEDYTCAFCVSC